jgi:hypothetical protein
MIDRGLIAMILGGSSIGAERSTESLILLSPFEVNTDQARGFVATSSLAGGRLTGELKYTPVAYSVLTRDFIDAMQPTDLTEMAKWGPRPIGGDLTNPARVATPNRFSWITPRNFTFTTSRKL